MRIHRLPDLLLPLHDARKKDPGVPAGRDGDISGSTNREIYLRSNIKIGYGIILIGVFCPFFWFAFFSGAQGNDLMFNAVHSGIVILFGLLYFATYWIQLRNEQVTKKHHPLPSQETR